jgi:hypothetical protein
MVQTVGSTEENPQFPQTEKLVREHIGQFDSIEKLKAFLSGSYAVSEEAFDRAMADLRAQGLIDK